MGRRDAISDDQRMGGAGGAASLRIKSMLICDRGLLFFQSDGTAIVHDQGRDL
ncbi:hypothetical protein D3C77_436010 [compost metagenome]